jgi:hypothetical protein
MLFFGSVVLSSRGKIVFSLLLGAGGLMVVAHISRAFQLLR